MRGGGRIGRGKKGVAANNTGSQSESCGGKDRDRPRASGIESLEEQAKANAKVNSSSSPSTCQGMLGPKYFETFTIVRSSQDTAGVIKNVLESPKDLNLICEDGVVSIHRIFLTCISKFMCDLLSEWDIKDTPSVTLAGFSIHHMEMVRDLVYDGKIKIRQCDMATLHEVLKLLSVDHFVTKKFKKVTVEDASGAGVYEPQTPQLDVLVKTEAETVDIKPKNNEEEEKQGDAIVRETKKTIKTTPRTALFDLPHSQDDERVLEENENIGYVGDKDENELANETTSEEADSVILLDSDNKEMTKCDEASSMALRHNVRNRNSNPDPTHPTFIYVGCICGYGYDDGLLIHCNKCSRLQHKDCMEIPRRDTPVSYLCLMCKRKPRHVELVQRLKARKIQDFNVKMGLVNEYEHYKKNYIKTEISSNCDDAGGNSDTLDSQANLNLHGNRKRRLNQHPSTNRDVEAHSSSQIHLQNAKRPRSEMSLTTTIPDPIDSSEFFHRKKMQQEQPKNPNGWEKSGSVKTEFPCLHKGCYCGGRVFNNRQALYGHNKTADAQKCNYCNRRFPNNEYLNRHVRQMHQEILTQSTRISPRRRI